MRRGPPARLISVNLVLALAGLLLLGIVLVVLIDQRRLQEQIALTENDLQAVRLGEPIADRLSGLPGFAPLSTISIDEYGPGVMMVYRKSVGNPAATGMRWDICVDQHGRVSEIRRDGAGHR
jgi:hypothetical protein